MSLAADALLGTIRVEPLVRDAALANSAGPEAANDLSLDGLFSSLARYERLSAIPDAEPVRIVSSSRLCGARLPDRGQATVRADLANLLQGLQREYDRAIRRDVEDSASS